MHANVLLIERFYRAFQKRDADGMVACYTPDVHFSDPVFPDLHGDNAKGMWRMLCARGKDLSLEFHNVQANDETGSVNWVAHYTFTATGKKVTNRVRAQFRFRDGLIFEHVDDFSFWTWASQSLGVMGRLLGWTGFLRAKVQKTAAKGLEKFQQS